MRAAPPRFPQAEVVQLLRTYSKSLTAKGSGSRPASGQGAASAAAHRSNSRDSKPLPGGPAEGPSAEQPALVVAGSSPATSSGGRRKRKAPTPTASTTDLESLEARLLQQQARQHQHQQQQQLAALAQLLPQVPPAAPLPVSFNPSSVPPRPPVRRTAAAAAAGWQSGGTSGTGPVAGGAPASPAACARPGSGLGRGHLVAVLPPAGTVRSASLPQQARAQAPLPIAPLAGWPVPLAPTATSSGQPAAAPAPLLWPHGGGPPPFTPPLSTATVVQPQQAQHLPQLPLAEPQAVQVQPGKHVPEPGDKEPGQGVRLLPEVEARAACELADIQQAVPTPAHASL